MLAVGWTARQTDAVFYELCKESWRGIWAQYVWWGKGWHYFFHREKSNKFLALIKMTPIGGFFSGVLRMPIAYILTRRKILVLLPFHYSFKRIAFCYGVTKSHLMGYGH
jgi:hypothetical protein